MKRKKIAVISTAIFFVFVRVLIREYVQRLFKKIKQNPRAMIHLFNSLCLSYSSGNYRWIYNERCHH